MIKFINSLFDILKHYFTFVLIYAANLFCDVH